MKIKIKTKIIEKNGDHAKSKFNLEAHLMPKYGHMEPFMKLNNKETKHWKNFNLSKNVRLIPLLESCGFCSRDTQLYVNIYNFSMSIFESKFMS